MKASDVQSIAVLGTGLMGHGIAQDFAAHGYEVHLFGRRQAGIDQALDNVRNGLARLEDLGQLTAQQVASTLPRIRTSTVLEEVAVEADLVVEAVFEDLALKQDIFRALDRACPFRTILTSTTSSLLPSTLASVTQRPDRVLVAHYFNPPTLVPMVEVVRGPETSDDTVDTVRNVLLQTGKRPAVLHKEVPGFIGNRLQAALLREALSLVERGVATAADIDTVVKYSFGPRMGAAGIFEMRDLAGLDLLIPFAEAVMWDLESSTGVPRLLREKVDRGELGVKSGQGFYTWTPESTSALQERIARALIEVARSS